MTTTVTITPSPQVLVTGTTFELKPTPGAVLYSEEPRSGVDPILYETITPTPITVVAAGICPPIPPGTPNLITSVTLTPGTEIGGGTGCTVLQGAVGDIPEMKLPFFSEPTMQYGTVTFPAPGVPTAVLPSPLIGYYSEKYFYDQEYIFAQYFKKQLPPNRVDKMVLIDLINGNKEVTIAELDTILADADNGRILPSMFTKKVKSLTFGSLANSDPGNVLTSGNQFLEAATREVTAWIKMKPSEIQKMQYNYVLTVTHTCPPYITRFYGKMVVNNNWDPIQSRLQYYLNKATGLLDPV